MTIQRRIMLALLIAATACAKKPEAPAPNAAQKPAATPAATEIGVGSAMPAYTAQNLDGSAFDIRNERGNVVLLNLWATWCGPCRFEIPDLQKLHDRHAARRFKVVGVSVDEGKNAQAEVTEFARQQKMTYPIVLDPEGKLSVLLDTTVLPTSVLVDRGGRVVWKQIGLVSGDDPALLAAMEKALKP